MAKINKTAVREVIKHAERVKTASSSGEALRESRAGRHAAKYISRDSKSGRFVDSSTIERRK